MAQPPITPKTESLHSEARALDARPDAEVLGLLLAGQSRALAAVEAAFDPIAEAASLMAQSQRSGRQIIYAAAGSSALAAMADGLELPGTFGLDPDALHILMAGGVPTDSSMPGATEDDIEDALEAAKVVEPGDVVIALTASGSTPYTCAVARHARKRGAKVVCIANNPGARIFDLADVPIYLATPAEVVAGSTRLGAGTAQKAALNLMSTLMGIKLGHVYDGMMVNVLADNTKLRARAARMVMAITHCSQDDAEFCLDQTHGAVKPAVLLAAGAERVDDAFEILARTGGNLRHALAAMNDPVKAG